MGTNGLGLSVKHSVIPILMEESPKTLIRALFLGLGVAGNLAQLHYHGGLKLVVVHHCSVCVNIWRPHLQGHILIGSGRSGSMSGGVLGSGVLMKTTRSWPLCKLLGLSSGSPA
jgi:hypothetical protein